MGSDLRLVFCVSDEWLCGPRTISDTEAAQPAFRRREFDWLLGHRVVNSRTYSMQQSDFARHGFDVMKLVASGTNVVLLDTDVQLIGLGTRDRYAIFNAAATPITYDELDEWRESPYHPEAS